MIHGHMSQKVLHLSIEVSPTSYVHSQSWHSILQLDARYPLSKTEVYFEIQSTGRKLKMFITSHIGQGRNKERH